VNDLTVGPWGDGSRHIVRWREPEPGARYRCVIGADRYPSCVSGLLFAANEGIHEVSVYAIDRSGNESAPATVEYAVVETALRARQPGSTPVRKPGFSAASGIATSFECSIDNGPWAACGTPARPHADTPLKLPAVTDGRHALAVRGRLGAVVDLSPAKGEFTLDTTPPETTIAEAPAGLAITATENGELQCRVDDKPFEVCASPYTLPPLAPGVHTFEAFATDALGNADPTPAKHTWTIAAPKPVATPTPTPTPTPEPTKSAGTFEAPVAVAPVALAPAQKVAFALSYRFRKGRFMRLQATGVPAGAKLVVTVKQPRKRATSTTVARLVGKRLPNGTKITVRAGAEVRKLTIRAGRVK
jgi:hypothetical protein